METNMIVREYPNMKSNPDTVVLQWMKKASDARWFIYTTEEVSIGLSWQDIRETGAILDKHYQTEADSKTDSDSESESDYSSHLPE